MKRALLAGLVVLLALGAAPLRPVSAATSCTAVRYITDLQDAARALGAAPPRLQQALDLLRSDEQLAPVSRQVLDPVIDDLLTTPPATAAALGRLRQLAAVLALPPGSTCHVDSTAALSQLHQVYGSRVFANLDQNQQPSLVDTVLQWLASAIAHIVGALGRGGSIALGAVLLAAALALAWWRARGVAAARAARLREEPREPGDDAAAEWAAALRAAQRGEHREAVRRAFRSALLEVALRGRLRIDSAWTTRELLERARGDADLMAALAAAAASFDRAWYSGAVVSAEDWLQGRARCETVRTLARRPAAERTL